MGSRKCAERETNLYKISLAVKDDNDHHDSLNCLNNRHSQVSTQITKNIKTTFTYHFVI